MGLFINTLPVRITAGEEGVEAAVRRTHILLADLMRHEHASLALAQRCSAIPAPTPLFSALLNYRYSPGAEQPASAESLQAWEGIQLLRGEERSNYPLALSVDDLGRDFVLTAQAPVSVGPLRICEFMRTALTSLVEALESTPVTPVRDLEVLPASERRRVLYEWNNTARDYPTDKCVHELIEEQVRRNPHAVAVIHGDQQFTYTELNGRANQLAHHLRELGVKPDARVAICAERSFEMIVGLLAVLKAGGAYVPLDPAYPVERLRFMLQDCIPVAILAQKSLRELASQLDARLPFFDLNNELALDEDRFNANPDPDSIRLTPEHLAYVIYTSGSTGQPKGVTITHRNLVNLIHWHRDAFGLKGGSRSSSVAGCGFDAAAWEIWSALCSGATLALPSSQDGRDPEALLLWWKTQNLDISFLPTQIAELAFAQDVRNIQLQTLLIGGDRLHHLPVVRPPFAIVNNYGPTEATVVASSGRIEISDTASSIGRPIANARIYILDAHGEPAPVGVAGELYIGGAGVARGYLNRPELTAERFLKDPFVIEPGERMYRSGDLGRWLPNGSIEFLGRNDDQVKIRGFRIEPGEIATRLAEHPLVREAVVVAREDTPDEKRLVAYYTSSVNEEIEEAGLTEQLRTHLSASLPQHMVPAAYVRLEKLPLTPNGKLDRRALPAPDGNAYAVCGYEPPQGEIEDTLAKVWTHLLGVDNIGRHDNFFALGGHSLLVMRMVASLKRIGIEILTGDLFTHDTIESLARKIALQRRSIAADCPILIRGDTTGSPLFLVHCGAGELFYVSALAPFIDRDVPIYGLPADDSELQTVEAMAARLVMMIRSVQADGPYWIAGWSFGGILAYEVAAQLTSANQEVAFLGLLDTYHPFALAASAKDIADSLSDEEHLSALIKSAANIGDGLNWDDVSLSTLSSIDLVGLAKQYPRLLRTPKDFGGLKTATPQIQQSLARRLRIISAYLTYAAPRILVPVHLFATIESTNTDATLGWNAIVLPDQLRITRITGTHLSMMQEPNVAQLGQTLSNAIRNEAEKRDSKGVFYAH
jgi:amino acid adenylation domain-containing protein